MGAFEPLRFLRTRIVALAAENIDTDQIIPARFMTTMERTGLGQALFKDWRTLGAGQGAAVLDALDPAAHRALVVGHNFGSGSSREHAVWAMVDHGFRVTISSRVADIFTANAAANGLLTVEVPPDLLNRLLSMTGCEIIVDLEQQMLAVPEHGLRFEFQIDAFRRRCLLTGQDPLTILLERQSAVNVYLQASKVQRPDLRELFGSRA